MKPETVKIIQITANSNTGYIAIGLGDDGILYGFIRGQWISLHENNN